MTSRGNRTLPHLIDERAREDPERVFYVLTESVHEEKTRAVTYRAFARAIDRAAKWLHETLGSGTGCPTIAFVSRNPCDLRYFIMTVAGMKTGYNTLLPSSRNSTDNYSHLLKETACSVIISDMQLEAVVNATNVRKISPPSLDDLLAPGNHDPYVYTKTFEEAKADAAFTLHSSGSTGPPKPIPYTHSKLAAIDLYTEIPTPNGEKRILDAYNIPGPHFTTLPFFHAAGILYCLFWNVVHGHAHLSLPAGVMPTAENATQLLKTYRPVSFFATPSILEDMSNSEEMLAALKELKFVNFGGAGISDEAGEIINKCVPLYAHCGSTEAGCYPNFAPLRRDAVNYYYWSPEIPGVEFRENQGLYEMVFKRNDKLDWAIFHTFPDVDEYATKDLYEKHPEFPNHWKLIARTDDVLVLSNGEKVVPISMEAILRRSPHITGALVLGHKRFMTAALLELDTPTVSGLSRSQIIDLIRPYIDEANKASPGHARISLDRIILSKADKRMVRTVKGNVMRIKTLESYRAEIDFLFSDTDGAASNHSESPLVAQMGEDETERVLGQLISKMTSVTLDKEQDFFQAGMDSGNVLALVRHIKSKLHHEGFESASEMSPGIIYSNPTIQSLASAIRGLATGDLPSASEDRELRIRNMIKKYGGNLNVNSANRKTKSSGGSHNDTVMLTGSTGSLGCYLLHELISDPTVTRIYALNRSDKAAWRQAELHESKLLSADFSKVTFLQASFDHHLLGLSVLEYHDIVESVDLIIHNAWPVNFNQPLSSFEPHVAGVRHLVNLSLTSRHGAHIVFVSSVGTTGNWAKTHSECGAPEELIDDTNVPLDQGYSLSKFVSEHILALASQAGVQATICRVGQIAGPVERLAGVWNEHEWVPSLIKSSSFLKKLPESLGAGTYNIDWIPVDSMAKILVELGQHGLEEANDSQTLHVFNLVNRNRTDWSELVPAILRHMPTGTTVVPYNDWFDALKSSNEVEDLDTAQNPAVKLVEFWEAMKEGSHPSGLVTTKTCKASKTMETVVSVNSTWMQNWLKQWDFWEVRTRSQRMLDYVPLVFWIAVMELSPTVFRYLGL